MTIFDESQTEWLSCHELFWRSHQKRENTPPDYH